MRSDWDMASAQMALLANVNRDPKTPAKKPKDFHPFYCEREGIIHDTKEAFRMMKKLWTKKGKKDGRRKSD